jgi:hypothetical protein
MKTPDPTHLDYWMSGGDLMMRAYDGPTVISVGAASALHAALCVHLLDAAKRGELDSVDYLKRQEEQLRLAIQARRDWLRASGAPRTWWADA